MWVTGVSVYFLAIFHRSSLGVAGIAAAERFDISASQLSTFTMVQLLVYAAMQIPVGVMLDRFGPQRMLFGGAVVMTLAQLGFAFTGSYTGALAARVFVGMGDAMVFISILRLIASWFPPMRNPVMTEFTSLLGQCGALVAAVPLAASLSSLGWTHDLRGERRGRRRARHPGAARRPRRAARAPPSRGMPRVWHRRPRPEPWPGRTRAPGSASGRTSPRSSRPT